MLNNEEEIKTVITAEEYDQIIPKKKKPIILKLIQDEIVNQGLEGKLKFNPLETGNNANRKRYYTKAGVSVFEEYMSQLNVLPLAFLEVEIREIVAKAKKHFKLS